jgi:hypothetical protein
MASEVIQKLAGLDGKRALFLVLVIGFPIGPGKIAGVCWETSPNKHSLSRLHWGWG